MEEGYIKYNCKWTKCALEFPDALMDELNEYRSKLIDLNMIGKIPNGPGFGNISVRENKRQFYITGTNTGHISILNPEHISLVTHTNIKSNEVSCSGLSQASSESLSHAAIYETLDRVNAVIHIHHKPMWQHYSNKLPTTALNVAYGTPEMANEVNLTITENTSQKVIVLGGHEDGLIGYGTNLYEVFRAIENLFHTMTQKKGK